jgi:hypothetical protein
MFMKTENSLPCAQQAAAAAAAATCPYPKPDKSKKISTDSVKSVQFS